MSNIINLYAITATYGTDIIHCECMAADENKNFLPDVFNKLDIKPKDQYKVKITKVEFLKKLGL